MQNEGHSNNDTNGNKTRCNNDKLKSGNKHYVKSTLRNLMIMNQSCRKNGFLSWV